MPEISTSIDSVTLYTDRALVVRHGTASLEAGVQELLVVGLPLGLDVESLRASGRGAVGVKILGVEARERTQPKPSNQSAREIQDELDAAQDTGRRIGESDSVLLHRLETLRQLAEKAANRYAETLSKGETSLEAVTQLLDYVAEQIRQINDERAELELQKRENAALQMVLSSRLKQLQSTRSKTERVVSVLLESNGAGEWNLELSYIVLGASWRPIYDARVQLRPSEQELGGTLSLTYGALLTQHSGEDWKNVALTLSTARPGMGTLPPKLQPVWLDVERPAVMAMPAPAMARRKSKSAPGSPDEFGEDLLAGTVLAGYMAPPEPPPIEAEEVGASIEREGATVTFGLSHRIDVPSDGQSHRTAIATFEPPCRFDYTAIPQRASLAFLRAKVTNKSALSLLEGPVNVFRDGVFIGKSNLSATPPEGEFTLFLGPDEGVKTERELTARDVDKNLLGNVRRTHFAYALTLRNTKSHPVRLTLQDQIPVSRAETIKVKLRGAEPTPQVSELGVLSWELMLRAGETRVVRFDYGVESPRDVQVFGLKD
jgi:uncharacterized protein (TIGR02231 family)